MAGLQSNLNQSLRYGGVTVTQSNHLQETCAGFTVNGNESFVAMEPSCFDQRFKRCPRRLATKGVDSCIFCGPDVETGTLLQAASRADIPIVIICSDQALLRDKISLTIQDRAFDEALAEILGGTDYGFRVSAFGVIEVFSKHSNATAKAKLLTFRNHVTWDTTMFSAMVWGNLQMQMDPARKGFGGVLQVPEQDKLLPEKSFAAVSISDLLAWAASENKHIAWIIWPPPDVLKNTPQSSLWNLIFYDPKSEGPHKYCCLVLPKSN